MAKTIAAGIFMVRKDGRVLVCHPTNHKPDFWSIPKGKVEEGEDLIDAAIRETYEESNIDLSECKGIRALEVVNYSHKKKILHPFLVLERNNSNLDWDSFDLKCNSFVPEDRGGFPEMDSWKFVSIEEARNLLHYTQVYCLNEIERIIKSNQDY
jgi:8-oxo-dGTP pyrophosphatase MutT (NUDIX family)